MAQKSLQNKSKKAIVNPFESRTLKVLMMDFLVFYSKIQGIRNLKDLPERYQPIKALVNNLLGKYNIKKLSNSEIDCIDVSTVKDCQFILSGQEANVLALLRHLRNAIAHCNIFVSDKKSRYIIKDYDYRCKGVKTCIGLIEQTKFVDLIQVYKHCTNKVMKPALN